MRALVALLTTLALSLTADTAWAQISSPTTQRFALLIAAHEGGADLHKLRYAARDAGRFADVLVEMGGFSRADVLSVVDGDAATVRELLTALERRVRDSRASGNDVIVVVYYSGHAQDGLLRLGDDVLAMDDLKRGLEATGADVRLAFVDACGAGRITREKGAAVVQPFVVTIDEAPATTGQVIIASSSADEVSQESDDIQGSFFTHYLTTGLRGDADRDKDGKVTLDEAYTYAYGRTVAATSATRAGAQHPTYAFDLQGQGDVVLTTPGGADVTVEFPGELEGRYFVVDLDRQLFVAEVEKHKGGTSQIALPRGQYAIKKRTDSHLLMTRVQARSKGTVVVVNEASMERVSFADDYAKGTPIAIVDDRNVPIGVSLGVYGLVSAVTAGVDDGGLFPATGGLGAQLRLQHLLRRGLTVDVDVSVAKAQGVRTIDAGALGTASFDVDVTQVGGGVAVMWEQGLKDLIDQDVTVLVGPRIGALSFTHAFIGAERPAGLAQQGYFSLVPGVAAAVAWSPTSFAHIEVAGRASYLPYTVDELRHYGAFEVFASVWLDL